MTAAVRLQPPARFPAGLIAGRYRIGQPIGVGGSGTVFDGVDVTTGQNVAVKAIARDPRAARRARREIRAASELSHPNIVKLLDSADDDDYAYVVFELVPGQDLATTFRERTLGDPAILRALAAVCDALGHAHERGVVHRDIKPANILLRTDGVVKLTDFGIAHIERPDATIDDRLLGTLSYMAPEQVKGQTVTGAADVWGVGVVLYEALTGDNPFRAKTPGDLLARMSARRASFGACRPDLPRCLGRAIEHALRADPVSRPTAYELRDALLKSARRLETGEHEPLREETVPFLHRLRRTKKPPFHLALAPEPAPSPGAPKDSPGRGAAALPERGLHLLRSLDGRWLVPATSLALGAATLAALTALPFYPAVLIALISGLVTVLALRRPAAAAGVATVSCLPLLGNITSGLVPVAVIALAGYAALAGRAGRIALLPLAAPVFVVVWPVYLLIAGRARSASERFAIGVAGVIVAELVLGLRGITSPLSGSIPGEALAAQLHAAAGVEEVLSVLWSATGPATLVVALGSGALASIANAAGRVHGERLRWFGAVWISAAVIILVLGPAVVTGTAVPLWPAAVGAVAAAILIGIRSIGPSETAGGATGG